MDIIATIIGYTLFVISEILPFINIPTNGFLHTFIIGFQNAFKNPERDIEMANSLIQSPDFANIVNTISTNSQIKLIIDYLIANPGSANIITSIQTNDIIKNVINKIVLNPHLLNLTTNILSNPQLINNPVLLSSLNIPHIVDSITQLVNNPQLSIIMRKLKTNPELIKQVSSILDQVDKTILDV